MPSYYEAVGEEPTYELAESIIRAYMRKLKRDVDYSNEYPSAAGYVDYSLEDLSYIHASRFRTHKHDDTYSAMHIIIKHFPNIIKKSGNSIYVKYSSKHLLNANDLLVMDYYLLLLNQHEERVNKYQRYLKRQQDRQRNKLLFVLFLPFILFVLMILVGD